jgi:murein DD-endopeptidase MepM/ murein hydrolase activator NlpD
MFPVRLPIHSALLVCALSSAVLGSALWLRGSGESYISAWPGAPGGATQAQVSSPFSGNASPFGGQAQPLAGRGLPFGDAAHPHGNPLRSAQTIMTQGYGVGTHAPARIWGAIDLAIDGNGDGVAGSPADVRASQGAPIYATHAGVVTVTPRSYPAGNHVWIVNESYRTGYSHLDRFADGLASGQTVQRGDLIGYLGNTGMSTGPHLDYQVWVKENGTWVNYDPHGFAPFE